MTAIRSSIFSGFSCIMTLRIPEDSNWKTPSVAPFDSILKTAPSSMGISSIRNSGFSFAIIFWAFRITERFRRPRKSILRRPSSSRVVMVYCVTTASPFFASGTYSATGLSVITTPAACVEALRGIPSSCRAMSIRLCTCRSVS